MNLCINDIKITPKSAGAGENSKNTYSLKHLFHSGYPNFEVVVWTVENSMTFYPIILGMDPQQQYIMYKLYRDATRYVNGVHLKDLSSLNRDLRKVIVIDWNKDHVQVSFKP